MCGTAGQATGGSIMCGTARQATGGSIMCGTAGQATGGSIMRCVRFACRINKAQIHKYVILFAWAR